MKAKAADKVKTEVLDHSEPGKMMIDSNINNNDISMFNQNNLGSINELRIKLQENFLANSGLKPNEISNLKREIKIEFWGGVLRGDKKYLLRLKVLDVVLS